VIVQAKEHSERSIDVERFTANDCFDRPVGRESKRLIARVAHVIPAECVTAPRASVIGGGVETNDDARLASNRSHLTDQKPRSERSVALEAWTEIGDLDAAALRVYQPGDEYRSIVDVVLLDPVHSLELDREDAGRSAGQVAAQEGTENRITIEAGEAAPRDGGPCIDEGADASVADQA
jgi:hypothetical protein